MDHPRPGLRYVDANDLNGSTVTFKGLEIDGMDGEKLGTVDGFILDRNSARPYYVVANAGGWFRSKRFLVPIGYVGFGAGDKKLMASLTKDRVKGFPGFDKDEFKHLSEDELKQMDDQMWAACCEDEPVVVVRWEHTQYQYPSWWEADFYNPKREAEGIVK